MKAPPIGKRVFIAGTALLLWACCALAENLPPRNPYLADSPWPMIHGGSDSGKISRVAGPKGPSRALRGKEIVWKSAGPYDLSPMAYSGPYPDGRRVIHWGTLQNLVKVDADTLETLSTYSLRDGAFLSHDEVVQVVDRFDSLVATGKRQALYDEAAKYLVPPLRDPHVANIYGFINHKNERLIFYTDRASQKHYLRFYGDAVEGDAASAIVMRRQWELPEINGKPFVPFTASMTYDGWIVVVSSTGMMLAVAEDFREYRILDLATAGAAAPDAMQSFVRNGISIDDRNGIYVVTKDFLARVQWTGSELSLDPALGAWKAAYPSGERGSGTTPALMGWGKEEDRLVAIADGTDDDPHLMLFWRDGIPLDWKGVEGYDPRVAGVAQVVFDGRKARARIENSPPVKGYGIFAAAESPTQPVPPQGSVPKQFIAETIAASFPGSEAVGGTKWQWNPKARKLELAWMSPLKLAESICTASINGILYCIGRRDGNFTLEGIDWNSGKSAFHYTLGPSYRYFSYTNLVVAPNGAVDLLGWVGLGLVRIRPGAFY